jgi:hypothetical protein
VTRMYDWIWLAPFNGSPAIYVFARRSPGGWMGWQHGQERTREPIITYLEGLWKKCDRPVDATEPVEYD